MKFYLDEHLSQTIATLARRLGVDVVSSIECGRNGLTDQEQLRLAASDDRCFVSQNSKHLVPLTTRFFQDGWPHAGLLLVPRSLPGDDFSAVARALERYDHDNPDGVQPYTIDYMHG